jgi:hypothetical protein
VTTTRPRHRELVEQYATSPNDAAELLDMLGLSEASPQPVVEKPADTRPPKRCNQCQRLWPATEYYRDAGARDGLLSVCKRCNCRASKRARLKRAQTITVTEKWCSRCEQTLPADAFGQDKTRPSGLNHYCRQCLNEAQRARRTKPGPSHTGARAVGRPITHECGTRAAYDRHRSRGEEPCEACTAANTEDSSVRKAAYRALIAKHRDEFTRLVAEARAADPCEHAGGPARSQWRYRTRYLAMTRLREAHPEEYQHLLLGQAVKTNGREAA